MADPIVEQLSKFTACDIADALLKLKHPNGGFLAGITLWSPERQAGPTKIVGPAYTVKYAVHSDPVPKIEGHYIDTIPKGVVIFISSPVTPNAVFGGLMSTRAQVSGAVGTVIDGRLRDLQEHRDLGYPVFARDVSTTAPQEVAKVVGVDVPVHFTGTHNQDVTIQPGDYIVADLNGVVVLPKALAEKAIPLIQPQVSADEQMAEAIKGGMTFVEASKKFRGK
ncbi:hypothetical protein SEUCBS140593_007814 [Sporothrix eucalyptigena]|uniref:Uncharacterized protein n=1 Tax=Sporothrix eucalyptigena TaxID=1812306 RepID=A0ABP0CGB8_9PEZI